MSAFIHHPPTWAVGIGLLVVGYITFEVTRMFRAMALDELQRRREKEDADQ